MTDLAALQTFANCCGIELDVARAFSALAPVEDVMYLNAIVRPDEARARMLDALALLAGDEFVSDDLETAAGVSRSTAGMWIKRLVEERVLEQVTRRIGNDPARYRVREGI